MNTATAAYLMRGLGLSPLQAEAIVAYQNKKGPFTDIDAVKRVEGVDAALIDAKKKVIRF